MGYSHTGLTSSCIQLKWCVSLCMENKVQKLLLSYDREMRSKMDYFIILQADVSGKICNRNMSSFSSKLLS